MYTCNNTMDGDRLMINSVLYSLFFQHLQNKNTLLKSSTMEIKKSTLANKGYWLLGIHRLILADKDDTEGHCDLVEGTAYRGAKTPFHVHTKYSETIYILAGELTVYMRDEVHLLKKGDHMVIQKNIPHALLVSGSGITKTLTTFSPGGFADIIRKTGIPGDVASALSNKKIDMDKFIQLSSNIGDITLHLDDITSFSDQ